MFHWETVHTEGANDDVTGMFFLSLATLNAVDVGDTTKDLSAIAELYNEFKFMSYKVRWVPAMRKPVGTQGFPNPSGTPRNAYSVFQFPGNIQFAKPISPPNLEPFPSHGDMKELRGYFEKSKYSAFTISVPLRTQIHRTYTDVSGGLDVEQDLPARRTWLRIGDDESFYSRVNHGQVLYRIPDYDTDNLGSDIVGVQPLQRWILHHTCVVMFRDNR